MTCTSHSKCPLRVPQAVLDQLQPTIVSLSDANAARKASAFLVSAQHFPDKAVQLQLPRMGKERAVHAKLRWFVVGRRGLSSALFCAWRRGCKVCSGAVRWRRGCAVEEGRWSGIHRLPPVVASRGPKQSSSFFPASPTPFLSCPSFCVNSAQTFSQKLRLDQSPAVFLPSAVCAPSPPETKRAGVSPVVTPAPHPPPVIGGQNTSDPYLSPVPQPQPSPQPCILGSVMASALAPS